MITVFGSIGMDLLFSLPHLPAVGETVLTPAYTTAMGGKGANQAVAAARDGGRVRFVGSAGTDGFGYRGAIATPGRRHRSGRLRDRRCGDLRGFDLV